MITIKEFDIKKEIDKLKYSNVNVSYATSDFIEIAVDNKITIIMLENIKNCLLQFSEFVRLKIKILKDINKKDYFMLTYEVNIRNFKNVKGLEIK